MRACRATAQRRGRACTPESTKPPRRRARAPRRGCRSRRRGTAAGTAAQSTGPQSSSARSRASRSDGVAGLGGRQLGDRADAEGVDEPRRVADPGVQVEALADALLGQQQRHVVGAGGQARAGQPALGEHRDQLEPAQREVRRQHPGGPDREAVDRRQRVTAVPDAAEGLAEAGVVASRSPSRRSGRRSAGAPSGGCRHRGRGRPRRPVAWPTRARTRACDAAAGAAP